MRKLLIYLKPYRWQVVVGMAAKLLEAVLELLIPLLMAQIIDVGIHQGDVHFIFKVAVIMLFIIFLGLITALLCQYYAAIAAQGMGKAIRIACMDKITSFSYAELDRFGNAALMNRMTNDVNQVVAAVNMFIRLVSRAPFLCIGAVLMSFIIDARMALIFLVFIPLLSLALLIIIKKTTPLFRVAQDKLDRFGRLLKEHLGGVRVIRAFSRQKEEKAKVHQMTQQLTDAYVRVTNLSSLLNPLTTVIMNFGVVVILYLGGVLVNQGELLQGDVVALMNYITQVLLALTIVANLMVLFTKAASSAQRIQEVLSTTSSVVDSTEQQKEFYEDKAIITFSHVDFSFGGEKLVLNDIHFSLKAGETLGIVGATGSGKSVLLNLIPRFYDPTKGEICFGGVPLRLIPLQELRAQIGIVPQKTVLFSGDIAGNLRFGNEHATDRDMMEALRKAQALSFVEALEQGLASTVHEGGKNFSGGQRQRLAIARAFVKKPRLLLLDDSLSALDFQTDLMIRKNLKEGNGQGAAIIVSQRISSVLSADKILVLDGGRQVGYGDHERLLKDCSVYRDIYESQMQKEA